MTRTFIAATITLAIALGSASVGHAQGGIADRLKRKAKEKIEQRVEKRTDEAMDKALDKAEGSITCAVSDEACIEKAQADGKSVVLTDQKGNVLSESGGSVAGGASAKLKPGEGAWANYDFVPGERVLFFEDFAKDEVGDFPRRLELISGNLEIVESQGGRYLRTMTGGVVEIPLPELLPERFTIEFDFAGSPYSVSEFRFDDSQGHNLTTVRWTAWSSAGLSGASNSMGTPASDLAGQMARMRLMVDGRYAKLYVNETRVANVPNAKIPRTRTLTFHLGSGHTDLPMLLGNIRIAAGGKKLYDVLAEKGRVATQGIYFSSGSDRIRPESTPTLKEIGTMLKDHPELKLTIEGHTDNVGDAEANHTLSHLRASAVKKYLETTFDIASERLTATGFGAKKPAAKNDTPEGRQQNRRVELVRG